MTLYPSSTKAKYLSALTLAVVTGVLFWQVKNCAFINYDDDSLLLYNFNVTSGLSWKNLVWAFTSTDKLQWVPVTWLSHMLDFQLYGINPAGHHVTNAVLHLCNTIVLLLVLYRMTGAYWRSFFVAALFALHPLHVEPVAWVTARKDTLSTLLFLITLLLYVRYVRQPRTAGYVLVLCAYLVTLTAKPMLVTLPLVLLILDYWPLNRLAGPDRENAAPKWRIEGITRLVWEKVPFLLLSVIFSGVVYFTQSKAQAVTPFQLQLLGSRLANILVAYAGYVWKTFWPARLAVVYPYREVVPLGEVLLSAAFLLAVSGIALKQATARRYLLVGWLWFLVTLLPVIGIVQIGSAYMADKFTYVPLIGLFVIIAWGGGELAEKWRLNARPWLIAGSGAVVLGLLALRSGEYLACWKDSKSLYLEALKVTENNFLVTSNLAAAYEDDGDYGQAIRYYLESIRIEPRFEAGYANIGYLYLKQNDCAHAVPYFISALQLKPDYPKARAGLGVCGGSLPQGG